MRAFKKTPHDFLPDAPPGIDWTNPITEGLVFCPYLHSSKFAVDMVSGIEGTFSGTHTDTVSRFGRGVSIDDRINFPSVPHDLEQGPLSVVCWFEWDGTSQSFQTSVSINNDIGMYLPNTSSNLFMALDSTATTTRTWSSISVQSGVMALYGYTFTGTGVNGLGYKDGVFIENSNASMSWSSLGTVSDIDIGYGQGGEKGHGKLPFVAIFNRVLEPSEFTELFLNPFTLWEGDDFDVSADLQPPAAAGNGLLLLNQANAL